MVEERLAHLADHVVLEIARHVDAVDLGAQRAGDRPDLDMAVVAHRFIPLPMAASVLAMKCLMPSDACGPAQQADQALGGVVEHGAIILRGAGQHQTLDGRQRLRLQLQDVVDHRLQGPADLGRGGAEMTADAQAMGFRRVDHPAGDGEVARRALADAPHHERDDLRGDEAHLGLGHAEARAVVQDHDVGAAGHAEAAAHRRALDDGDGGLRQAVERQQRVAELAVGRHQRIGGAVGRLGRHVGHGVEIAAGAEMPAGAAQHQHAAALIVAHPAKASSSSSIMAWVSALRRSGRFSTSRATAPSRSSLRLA